ncbi:type VI secretion system tip protein VgrG [Oligella urethralis]|uniref:type VI secretion system Vgr family protein n=1 Tax=Oligella urethralis TaxID=90245 RepID=UPI000C9BD81E|nr:type VI secretion system tip protein TssI/VgrG [Oligella urethralis]PMC16487.1 type VI secretion system tip protein VgrG [Oligella urethralis]
MKKIFKISGSFAEQELLFRSLSGDEAISSLYEFQLQFLSKDIGFDAKALIGEEITLNVEIEGKRRYLSGLVTRVKRIAQETLTERYFIFEASIRPWLWLATQNNHYKIHQKKTIPEIIRETLEDYPFELEFRTSGSYRQWGYCVQYDETDFEFISRLMEHEGLYYWFEHSQAKHRLIIADDRHQHKAVAAYDSMKFYDRRSGLDHEEGHFYQWQPRLSLSPNKYAAVDYNLNKPNVNLSVQKNSSQTHHHGVPLEIYQAIGDYAELEDGERYAAINIEIFEAQRKTVQALSNSPLLSVGELISLERHPDRAQNQQYLITAIHYDLAEAAYATNEEQKAHSKCAVKLIPATVQYRQPKLTPIPYTYGPQTAIVVGPQGESIWTDEYGRVKVKFHWDSAQIDDGDSSCWVRVSSPWAGGGFGGMQIPRVNEEVIVDFLGGHPDRPVIVGRLYNADNMPPVELPANATVSGFHTRTKDGTSDQANSVLFEDALGNELVKMVAQKSMDYFVKNDSSHNVGGSSATNIGGAHHWSYGGMHTKKVGGNAAYQHESGHTLTVSGNSTDTVHQRQRRSYTGPNTETTGGTEQLTVASEPAIHSYDSGYKQNITGVRKDTVAANKHSIFQDAEVVQVAGSTKLTVSGGEMNQNAQSIDVKAGDYSLQSGASITDLSANYSSEAGATETQLSMENSVSAVAQKIETITSCYLGLTVVEGKAAINVVDYSGVKLNANFIEDAHQASKAALMGVQIKVVHKVDDMEKNAGSLIGIDLSKMNLTQLHGIAQKL